LLDPEEFEIVAVGFVAEQGIKEVVWSGLNERA
jgi:hypothetical protein